MKDPQPATATARQQAAAELGRRLQALSAARGLDPGELARQANVSRTTLYNLLQGRTASPRASTLARLATVLGVSPESLHPACPPLPLRLTVSHLPGRSEKSPQLARSSTAAQTIW